ncbi:hypothetical protein Fot_32515 [Forsythia ovata]|uniref:Biogenesis of lysosome-related organelles complex 1 subunit 1 n=1 Tax=Forsythia ovata TaxID=205694 RepID=A0ABD1T8G0_9LAMI
MGHLKNILEGRPMEISSDVLNMLPDPASKGTVVKAMASRSLMLIDEAEAKVRNMELTKKSSETALRNADKIIKDRDHFRDQVTWLQGSLSELKNELKILTEDMDKLRVDLASSKVGVTEFLKKYDHTNHA